MRWRKLKTFITEQILKGYERGMVEFVVVPNNTSLLSYVDAAMDLLKIPENYKIIKSRGEDIPLIVEEFSKRGINAIGMTGKDLLKEYRLSNGETKLSVVKIIPWLDKNAIFGKPVLCLLGPKNKKMEDLPKNLRICINSKYKNLANKYLNQLELKDYSFEKVYLSGSTEAAYSTGLTDLVIDIVYTGTSIRNAGLEVYDKIYESDFVIIGIKNSEETAKNSNGISTTIRNSEEVFEPPKNLSDFSIGIKND